MNQARIHARVLLSFTFGALNREDSIKKETLRLVLSATDKTRKVVV